MSKLKRHSLLICLVFLLALVACGDDDDDSNNDTENNTTANQGDGDGDGDGNGNGDEPTVSESDYVDACVAHNDECETGGGNGSMEEGCAHLWQSDLDNASNPGACVDSRVEAWNCMVDDECGDGPECMEPMQGVGEYCQ